MPTTILPFKGPTLGTDGSCTAQAVLLGVGSSGTVDTTLCLVGYYVCVAFRVSEKYIKKQYLPIFLTYIAIKMTTWNVSLYKHGFFNIQNWSPHCGFSPIPNSCWSENGPPYGVDCAWPTRPDPYFDFSAIGSIYIIVVFCLIVVGMALVIFTVYRNERKTKMDDSNREQSSNQLKQTRLIMGQAALYIITFLTTWILTIVPLDTNSPEYHDILESVTIPCQGILNMLIFVYFKISLIRRSDESIDSNYKAFKVLLMKPKNVPEMVFSGILEVKSEDHFLDDNENDLEDTGSSKNPSSFTSNPSAYDGLSNNTPPSGSQGLSGISDLHCPTPNVNSPSSPCNVTLQTFMQRASGATSNISVSVHSEDERSEGLSYGLARDENSEGLSYEAAYSKGTSLKSIDDHQTENTH